MFVAVFARNTSSRAPITAGQPLALWSLGTGKYCSLVLEPSVGRLALGCAADSAKGASLLVFTGTGLDWGTLPLLVLGEQRSLALTDSSSNARLVRGSAAAQLEFAAVV
jgi:hypothetical protein